MSEQFSNLHESRMTTANRDLSAFDAVGNMHGITAGHTQVTEDGVHKPLLYSQNTHRDPGIKDKLESLRKLFAEEDLNQ